MYRTITLSIAIVLTLALLAGCGGSSGPGLTPVVERGIAGPADWAELNPGADQPFGLFVQKLDDQGEPADNPALSVSFTEIKSGLRAEIRATGELGRIGDYRLFYNPDALALAQEDKSPVLERETLSFASTRTPGIVNLVWCGMQAAPNVKPGETLWTLYFEGGGTPHKEINAFHSPPAVDDLAAELQEDDDVLLNWSALHPGDLDVSSVVTGSDLWPIILNWNLSVTQGDPEYCYDANKDGVINGMDVFVVAANYHNVNEGYLVFRSTVQGGPYTRASSSILPIPAPPVGECVPQMSWEHTSAVEGFNYYVVRSQDRTYVGEGPDSNEAFAEILAPEWYFFEDFEEPNYTWTYDSNGTGEQWARTDAMNHTEDGEMCGGIGYPTRYDVNEHDSMVTPTIDLTGASTPLLTFWHSYDTAGGEDGGVLDVSTNGGTDWTRLAPLGDYPSTRVDPLGGENEDAWAGFLSMGMASVSLADYSGETIRLRWDFASDENDSTSYEGWWIDDVLIEESVPEIVSATADPTNGDAPFTTDFSAVVQGGTPPYDWLWDFDDSGATSTQETPQHTYDDPGTYWPTLTITDALLQEATFDLAPVTAIDATPVDLPFDDDFEAGLSNWYVESIAGDGYWHLVTDENHSINGSQAARFGIPGVMEYDNNEDDNLISRWMDPGTMTDLELSFWHWMEGENSFDGGIVEITTDGSNWTKLTPSGGYPAQREERESMGQDKEDAWCIIDEWEVTYFDLSSYAGDNFRLRLNWASDESVQIKDGWFVDDVHVGKPLPKIDSITVSPNQGDEPLTVQYQLTTSGGEPPLTFAWDFGDEGTSTDEDPQHQFVDGGEYHAMVTVTDDEGMEASAWAPWVYVTDLTPLPAPVEFDFEDGRQGWYSESLEGPGRWDRKEGSTDNHTPDGSYGYKLESEDGADYGPLERDNLYSPIVDLSGQSAPYMIVYVRSDTTTGDGMVIDVSEDGGDWERITPEGGYPGMRYNPDSLEEEDAFAGTFAFTEYRFDLADYLGSEVRFKLNFASNEDLDFGDGIAVDDIRVGNAPMRIDSITASAVAGTPDLDVDFDVTVSGGVMPYTWEWDFDDGGSAFIKNPTHTYTTDGLFNAEVTVTDDDGDFIVGYAPAVMVGFWHEDFESGQGDWAVTPDDNEENDMTWELSVDANHTPGGSQGFLAGALSSVYGHYNLDWLDSPEIDLGGVSDPVLVFWHLSDTEANWDGGVVRVSTDGGGNWSPVEPVDGYPGQRWDPYLADGTKEDAFAGRDQSWRVATFDLADYAGEDVMLRFDFSTDGSLNYGWGWMIDDLIVGDFVLDQP